jgi:hypothetical protein
MSMLEAKKFLGNNFFKQALLTWSMKELYQTMLHSDCILSGADEAYEAIFRFRAFETAEGKKFV